MSTIIIVSLLLLLGVLLVVAEILLLPGVSVAAIASLVSFGGAVYVTYGEYGGGAALITLVIALVLSVIALLLSIRKRSLSKISLDSRIDSASSSNAANKVKIGDRGVAYTRLAPMGNVFIDGKMIEAKSLSGFIDTKEQIEVVGFEDSVVIVKIIN